MGVSATRKKQIDENLSKENLEKAYSEGYSSHYIATKYFPDFKTDASTVIDHAILHGVKTPTSKEAALSSKTRTLYRTTVQERYGCENVSQAQEVKDKKVESALREYGVVNVFQSEEIKKKSRKTCLEKYGTEQVGTLQIGYSGKRSKFQQKIESILDKNSITYLSEATNKFSKWNDKSQKVYSPIVDLLIEDYKLVIECYGDIWHANPNLYKPSDIITKFGGPTTSLEIWEFDKCRIEQIESFGWKVLIIWEADYNSNRQETERVILETIKNQENNKS